MKLLQPLLVITLLASSLMACLDDAPTEDPQKAPAGITATTADKVEIDVTGKVRCDKPAAGEDDPQPGNGQCFAADKDHCKSGDYSGACWCTHCEGGDFCEGEADHKAHEAKGCKLKPAADALVLHAPPAELSTASDPP